MITVTIIVKDGQRHIHAVLEALKRFDEVLIFDTGSCDNTLQIARNFSNVTIHESNFEGFGKAHNRAASLAKNDWILSIDADEVLSPGLAEEILKLKLKRGSVYSLPFHNFYRGQRVRIWDPESHVRLYNRKESSFTEALVHEAIRTEGLAIETLQEPLFHYSYGSISDFLVKMERYSTLFAEQNQGRPSSPLIALSHGIGGFLKNYFFKRGFLGGYRGFLISIYIGHTAFYKYMKLYEAQC